jgi:prephenate dehydrogenase
MSRLAIAGVGLIGGSFALALRKAGIGLHIAGIDLGRSLATALEQGVIDEILPLEEACSRADVIYLALPIRRILDLLPRVAPHCRRGCLVTDAGSTKTEIVRRAYTVLPAGCFLGGHPMAGKETRGVTEADPDLFQGRPYLLTPQVPDQMESPAAKMLLAWIEATGATPLIVSPEQHDNAVALTSHLPQMLATALAGLLEQHPERERLLRAAGPGLHDSTRLALSPWGVWDDIIATNRDAILAALGAHAARIEELRSRLQRNVSLEADFEQGRRFAGDLRKIRD